MTRKSRPEKFIWKDEDITTSQCVWCAHKIPGTRCAAFPDGIPDSVLSGRRNHINPIPGDNGIQFEREKK